MHVHQLGDVAVPEQRADACAASEDAAAAAGRAAAAEAAGGDVVSEGGAEGRGLLCDDVALLGGGLAGPDGLDEVAGVISGGVRVKERGELRREGRGRKRRASDADEWVSLFLFLFFLSRCIL